MFDNCQAAPPDSTLHEVIRGGLAAIPNGLSAILVSRKDLEVDDLEEEFYRGLMECYGRLSRNESPGRC
ncbi:MAG: hypothetical protein HW377_521 [Actinobacteria bacterium]|nr:hypothetical protein [Actinomycetota bacterium]